jgi:hypothetical protein
MTCVTYNLWIMSGKPSSAVMHVRDPICPESDEGRSSLHVEMRINVSQIFSPAHTQSRNKLARLTGRSSWQVGYSSSYANKKESDKIAAINTFLAF